MKNKFIFVILSFIAINAISSDDKILESISVENGFEVSIFSSTTNAPRQITEGNSGYIFVGSKQGDVYALKDHDGNGKADFSMVVASGMGDSSGVAFYKGSLFIAEIDKVWKIEDIEEKLDRGNSIMDLEKILVTDDLPSDTWHGWKWIDFGPDNKLYVPVGAPCNICNPSLEEKYNFDKRYASIMRLNEGEWEYVARGVRNTVGFDWHPKTNDLYFGDNGRDWMGDDMPSCELNVVKNDDSFYGYPYKHSMDILDPEYSKKIPDNTEEFIDPILELGAHVAPTGLSFYDGDHFPAKYKNTLFMTLHGSWNRSRKVGYKVIAVHFDENGELLYHKDFITGWLQKNNGQEKVLGRPASVFQKSDGSILISDDGANVIYRVSYQQS